MAYNMAVLKLNRMFDFVNTRNIIIFSSMTIEFSMIERMEENSVRKKQNISTI